MQNMNAKVRPSHLGELRKSCALFGKSTKATEVFGKAWRNCWTCSTVNRNLLARHNACSNIVDPEHDALILRATDARSIGGECLLEPWFILGSEGGSFCISFNSYHGGGCEGETWQFQLLLKKKYLAPRNSARKTDAPKTENSLCVCFFLFFVGGFVSTKKNNKTMKNRCCPCADLGTDTSHTGVASWTNWFTSFQAVPCIFLQGKVRHRVFYMQGSLLYNIYYIHYF